MTRDISTIYSELAAGRLTQQQALAQIKALQHGASQPTSIVFASPVWQALPEAASGAQTWAQQQILLVDLQQIAHADLMAGKAQCHALQSGANLADNYANLALRCLASLQEMQKQRAAGRSLLQVVIADTPDAHIYAGLDGLAATAKLENPDLLVQIVFVPPAISTSALAQQLQAASNQAERSVLRVGSSRQQRRWQALLDNQLTAPCAFKENGVYLITGGLGGLGSLLAQEILHTTRAAKIILTGRGAATGSKQAVLEKLQASGRVGYRQLDVGNAAQVAQLVASIVKEEGRLHGIFHSAGVLQDDFLLKKTAEQFSSVLQPKVVGTANLDAASSSLELDFFVLFSSIAAWAGNLGQADYACANGFMDQFASYRNALVAQGQRSGKTVSINWPHWLDGGMHVDAASLAQLEKRTGLRSMGTSAGMAALHTCIALPQANVMVLHGVRSEIEQILAAQPAALAVASAPAAPVANVASSAASADLAAKTREFLRKEFSVVLKIPEHRIDTKAALENYGIDSILAMNLTSQLEASFGALPKTLFFEYQTINDLADYFVRSHAAKMEKLLGTSSAVQVAPAAAAVSAPAPVANVASAPAIATGRRGRGRFVGAPVAAAATSASATLHEPIAIVGLSGRYPQAPDLQAFWQNLRDGKDCISLVPAQRWDWQAFYSEDKTKEGAHFSKWGGFIEGVDEFDPRFFNIAPREARSIDPQERIFLQHAWLAIEDAGYTRASLQMASLDTGMPGQVGVYAGVMYGEYNLSGSLASIANRVSYFLNVHGPSMTLDTMCSSSLTAIHLACQDLRLGRTSLGLAGGVNVSIHPNKYTMLSGGQFISTDGHCQSFGEGGDGYIPGEGVGVAVLKRLSDAQRDGNHIYALVRGSALNHGGKTNGYTVPNPQAQAEVIRRALLEAKIDARHVSYIEAHGTGTKLGDPIEIAALTRAFNEGKSQHDSGFCLIGSAKSNIGHCESAAGIAGVSKVVLQMQHQQIVPSLHSSKLNPHIDFASTPFIVNQSLRAWPQPELDGKRLPRLAGVSSFGAGGSNAHIILEEYIAPSFAAATAQPLCALLSARTSGQLTQRAQALLAQLEAQPALDLAAMSYTLQVGREAMEERAALVFNSRAELLSKLALLAKGDTSVEIQRGQVKTNKDEIGLLQNRSDFAEQLAAWLQARDFAQLLPLWVKGLEIDWRLLNGNVPRLISLPAYPFAKESYWLPASNIVTASNASAAAVLHPLLHSNTSNLQQQSYTSHFNSQAEFMQEEDGQKVLPALLALEMLQAALNLASPAPSGMGWQLHDMAWGEVIPAATNLNLALLPQAENAVDLELYSAKDGQERVHCQAHAKLLPQAAASLPLAQLQANLRLQAAGVWQAPGQLLAQLDNSAVDSQFALAPSVWHKLADFAQQLLGAPCAPVGLARYVQSGVCPALVFVYLQRDADSNLDVSLCDSQGQICLQLPRLQVAQSKPALAPVAVPVAAAAPTQAAAPVQAVTPAPAPAPATAPALAREIALTSSSIPAASPLEYGPVSKKPSNIQLAASVDVASLPLTPRASIALPALNAAAQASAASALRLFARLDLGSGIYALEIHSDLAMALAELPAALARVAKDAELRALLLVGQHAQAWQGGREVINAAITQDMYRAISEFACPVIAVVPQTAQGAGLLLAASCDFLFASSEGSYSFSDSQTGLFPTIEEERFWRARLGTTLAADFLYRSITLSGSALQAKGWAAHFVPASEVVSQASQFARALADKSSLALSLLKNHLSRDLTPLLAACKTSVAVEVDSSAAKTAIPQSCLHLSLGGKRKGYDLKAVLADLKQAVNTINKDLAYKSLLLSSSLENFLPAGKGGVDAAILAEVKKLVRACPVPVIIAFDVHADGLAWLVGLFCDVQVYSKTGNYSASGPWTVPALTRGLSALTQERFGPAFGQELCLAQGSYSGAQLQARVPSLLVVDGAAVIPTALALAASWQVWPRAVISAWKAQQSVYLESALEALPEPQVDHIAIGGKGSQVPSLQSNVVKLSQPSAGVLLLEMQERAEKNMFSPALVDGLKEAFAYIAQDLGCKAVVLTGYDSYFATGGTMATLLAIQQGQAQFTDEKAFQLALECPVPVIAAIQGHGIGGGLSFGMFADVVMLSSESRYLSPYMGYGFTPGAGSTMMFPRRIGHDLARESLLGAQEISGQQLQERGICLPVLPRRQVVSQALELASRIAQQPRSRLLAFKQMWTHEVRQVRDALYQREVAMHEQTFVSNAATLQAIQAKIAGSAASVPAPAVQAAAQPVQASSIALSSVTAPSASAIRQQIKEMLAQELFLQADEIDDSTQFIDLGLDSITGVTWIRKINAYYGTAIEATKVYSHPSLKQLASLLEGEIASVAAPASAPVPAPEPAVAAPAPVVNLVPAPAPAPASSSISSQQIIDKIKSMLAQELFLSADEIADNTPFIDLGLDSITGVTWIRKINAHFGIAIEATKVYSHPTLRQLSQLLQNEIGVSAPSVAAVPVPAPAAAPAPAPVAVPAAVSTPSISLSSIITKLKAMLAKELLLGEDELDEQMEFIAMGLDSITGVTWVRKINEVYQLTIEATKVYSHPTLQQMAQLVQRELGLQAPAAVVSAPAPVIVAAPAAAPVTSAATHHIVSRARPVLQSWRGKARVTTSSNANIVTSNATAPIAVIGMAGQFPQAKNLAQYWENLISGRLCISEVADGRWSLDEYYQAGAGKPGKTNCKYLGALEDFAMFDPLFFNISPTEAECMEPQQRLFLQACWHSIENAGYNPHALSDSECGVFVGCGPSEYLAVSPEKQLSAQGFTGAASSILAARISYFLNLRGPCLAIETACSSSLVAIANACDSLNNGNSDLALAGGVYVMAGPNMHVMSAQAGMLSVDGRCFTFDQRANGFVPGEAVGVLLLKRLADAEKDQDRIQAVIEGWGVNQDGKTNGITAPNEEAQTRLLTSVYRKFGIDPASISLIEAHGTGTKLGDPIEIAGLKAAFKPFTQAVGFCALGSVKSNIGHCLTAAGAAGFIKLILAMQHRRLPPTINFERRNEHIQLDNSPFYVNAQAQEWQVSAGQARRAAISSFGFGGTNAHLVLAEPALRPAALPVAVITQDGNYIVPLSARSEAQLQQMAQNLLQHLLQHLNHNEPALQDLAYTLQVGRDAMGERLGFMVTSLAELRSKLQAFLAGQHDGVYQGQVKRNKEGLKLIAQDDEMKALIVGKWLAEKKLGKLLDLWVKGLDLDWTQLYGAQKPQRIELPNYPFAQERYWLTAPAPAPVAATKATTKTSRPIVLKKPAAMKVASVKRSHAPAVLEKAAYSHEWLAQAANPVKLPEHQAVLIISSAACYGLEQALLAQYQGARQVRLVYFGDDSRALGENTWQCGLADAAAWETCLQDMSSIDAIYFIAANQETAQLHAVRNAQEANEIQLLRLVKYLKPSGKIQGTVDTYLLTLDNHSLDGSASRFWGAGAAGLGFSLAQGNHQFRVRNLDLSSSDLASGKLTEVIEAVRAEPASDRGEIFKLYQGTRYRHTFFRLDWQDGEVAGLKQGGVYLILGGSGTISQIITRYLVEKYQAQVVWLGRSAADAPKIQAALANFAAGHVHYLQADALSEASLRSAVAQIKQRHRKLDGAIFSGVVLGSEMSIDQTSEEKYREILEVKTLGSQAFYAALQEEDLDFMCFFSSGQGYSFSGATKVCAYATGITFADSFVRATRAQSRFPVGTINWGLWSASRERFAQLDGVSMKTFGALALEDAEGFGYFERFVDELQKGRLRQVLCMRATPEVEVLMNCSQQRAVILAPEVGPTPVDLREEMIAVSHERIAELVAIKAGNGLNEWFARLLFCQLDSMVQANQLRMPMSVLDICERSGVIEKYKLWLRYSLEMVAKEGLLKITDGIIHEWHAPEHAATWAQWRISKEDYVRNPDSKALAELIDECLVALPEILPGKILATDVIFPGGSMAKVAPLYRNNTTADTFNEIVGNTVLAYLQERLRLDPKARLRILEIGAGTGGTSAIVFKKLSPYKAAIEEYLYTDLSKAFFFHAEQNYIPDNPYIVCHRLDVEQPIEAQGIKLGSYDLVLSTNALHATKDIRRTMMHAKASMRKDAILIVSEMCDSSLQTHLTFGLLDGWWLFEDADLRIPGCPGLYPATWQRVLEDLGFTSFLMPGSDARPLGSQVVVAKSDGLLRVPPRPRVVPELEEEASETPSVTRRLVKRIVQRPVKRLVKRAAGTQGDVGQHIRQQILTCLSTTLKMAVEQIDSDIAFSDYGIDSILGVNFIDQINERLGLGLNTAIIFEYSSVARLSQYILDEHGAQLAPKASSAADEYEEVMEEVEIEEEVEEEVEDEAQEFAEEFEEEEEDEPAALVKRIVRQKRMVKRAGAPQDVAAVVRKTMLECLSSTLKIAQESIDVEIAFSDYGIDSILGVNFIEQINARLGLALNTAIIFEYSSIERLSKYVVENEGAQLAAHLPASQEVEEEIEVEVEVEEAAPARAAKSAKSSSSSVALPAKAAAESVEVAIIGMSGKFPKADNVEQFWSNLISGVDGVVEVPAEYLDQEAAYSPVKQKGKTRCKWAGILEDRACFDPLFFNISPKEAESMNPHQRLVMQESWNALEDAGYNPKALSGSQTALYLGAEPTLYIGDSFTGLSEAIVASRISYSLNFNGAAFVVNTGCSSSGVAIHLACEALRSGETEMVLAGGVNACIHQKIFVRLDSIDMLSPSGRCHTFDKAGDGTILSEGVGMVVLKRLQDAERDGDHIYASICGSGINQDGASNGITAPNGAAQEQLILNVYQRFGIDASQISYVEAHGTGTRLGDPVETNALVRAYRKYSQKNNWCAIGSAKSHIGHAAAAAGVIGVMKIVLTMQHSKFPKLLNFKDMNPLIQFATSPFYITTETTDWPRTPGVARMAALNSFGHSGTNAHLVLREYLPQPVKLMAITSPLAFPLSAKTPEQLQQKCIDLLHALRHAAQPFDLASLAYTLQVGREAMDERLGFVASSKEELITQLAAAVDGQKASYQGKQKRNSEVHQPQNSQSAASLLDIWANQGRNVQWEALWTAAKPQRMRLPSYPFAKERHWMEDAFGERQQAQASLPAAAEGESIEEILSRIADDTLATDEGVKLLKAMV